MKFIYCYFFISICFVSNVVAQQNDSLKLIFDIPLIDLPYQTKATAIRSNFFEAYANPSMNQSLAISNNFYNATHYGIDKLIKSKKKFMRVLLKNLLALGFDYGVSKKIPFGYSWLHEEGHRAVLTQRKINSYNSIYDFNFSRTTIPVNRLSDADLANLSDNYKPDFIRLNAAGIEIQLLQIQELQKQTFYYNVNLPHLPLYWLSTINNIAYLNSSSKSDINNTIDDINKEDGVDISKRDFTGPDFTAWAYALFNPNIPYAQRGTHPSGVGINRYVKTTQLTPDALNYLEKQGKLHFLNLISPLMFGFDKILLRKTEKGNYYGNFAVRHILTSFGNEIALDIFFQTPKNKFLFTVHNYNNYKNSFWGLEGLLVEKPLFHNSLKLNLRTLFWVQPKDQSFTSSDGQAGGLISVRTTYKKGIIYPYLELEGKTKGWVMGNVFLNDNVSVRMGFNIRIDNK